MKESKFTPCYVAFGGKVSKCGVAVYDDGRAALLYSARGVFGETSIDSEIRASGIGMHSMPCAVWLPSGDAAGVAAVYPGAVVFWPGSKEYQERENNKVSRPGGRNSGGAASVAAPVVAAAPIDEPASVAPVSCLSVVVDAMTAANFEKFTDMVCGSVVAPVDAWAAALLDTVSVDNVPGVDCSKIVNDSLNGFGPFAGAVAPVLVAPLNSWLAGLVSARVDELKVSAVAVPAAPAGVWSVVSLPGKYQVTAPDGTVREFEGAVHPAFEEILQDLADFKKIYLYGPAGTGKSYMTRQLAAVLGVPFYMSGKSDLKFDLVGSPDINGKLIETQFYKAFTGGGLWLWDETDRSSSDSGTAINEALANGYCEFPGVGVVRMHPDFYCIGTGNTVGKGRSQKYAGAQVQDEALLSRFLSKIPVEYCPEMDMIVTGGDSDLCTFAADFRAALAAVGSDKDLAIRLLMPMKQKAARRGYVRALQTGILAGVEQTQIKMLAARCQGSTPWHKALQELAA